MAKKESLTWRKINIIAHNSIFLHFGNFIFNEEIFTKYFFYVNNEDSFTIKLNANQHYEFNAKVK